jgi:hypothetical protein
MAVRAVSHSFATISVIIWATHRASSCRFRRKRFNWPETDPFIYETEDDNEDESKERTRHFTLPQNQSTDGLTPVRLFEIFEVFKYT